MTPDKVCELLKSLGADVSRRTLLRYEEQSLIPEANRDSGGKRAGRYTDYPIEAVFEAYSAWHLIRGIYKVPVNVDDFFDNKPPKLSPIAIKKVRSLSYLKKKEIEEIKDIDDLKSRIKDINDFKSETENYLHEELKIDSDKIEIAYKNAYASQKIVRGYTYFWEYLNKEAEYKLKEKGLV